MALVSTGWHSALKNVVKIRLSGLMMKWVLIHEGSMSLLHVFYPSIDIFLQPTSFVFNSGRFASD